MRVVILKVASCNSVLPIESFELEKNLNCNSHFLSTCVLFLTHSLQLTDWHLATHTIVTPVGNMVVLLFTITMADSENTLSIWARCTQVMETCCEKYDHLQLIIKTRRPMCEADRKCLLITDNHTEILDCIPCVMVFLLHSTRQALILTTPQQAHSVKCTNTSTRTNKQMDEREQTYYLPATCRQQYPSTKNH